MFVRCCQLRTHHCQQLFRPQDVFLHLVGILLHLQNQESQAAGLAPAVGGGGRGSHVRFIDAQQNVYSRIEIFSPNSAIVTLWHVVFVVVIGKRD